MSSVPEFIVKGAKILTAVLDNPSLDITPAFLREVKFNEVSMEWREKVGAHAKVMGFDESISPMEFVHELSKRAISAQLWRQRRDQQLFSSLVIQCPHICPPCSPLNSVLRDRNVYAMEKEINIEILNGVVMKYSRILSKITRLKALKMKRAKLIKENIKLLGEVTDEASINVRTLQNIADGVRFSDPFSNKTSSKNVSILEEMHRLSELLQIVEDDQKDEEMFWKWLSSTPATAKDNVSTGINYSAEKQWQLAESLLQETNNAVKSMDSKIAEFTADKKLQVYEHSDELIYALSTQLEALIVQLLPENESDSEHTVSTQSMESSFMEGCGDLWSQLVSDLVEISNAQSPFIGNIASKRPLLVDSNPPDEHEEHETY